MLGMDMRWYEGVLKWVTPLKPKPMVKVKPYGVLLSGNTHQDRGSKWGTHGEWTHSLALRSFSPSLGARVRPIRYDATAVNTWSRQPVFKDLIIIHHDVFFFGVSWEASTTRIYGGACWRPAKVGETPLYHWSESFTHQTGEELVRYWFVNLPSFGCWIHLRFGATLWIHLGDSQFGHLKHQTISIFHPSSLFQGPPDGHLPSWVASQTPSEQTKMKQSESKGRFSSQNCQAVLGQEANQFLTSDIAKHCA